MKKSSLKLVIGAGIAAASVGAALVYAYKYTENLMSMAMDRSFKPKSSSEESSKKGLEKVTGEKTSDLFSPAILEGAERLKALDLPEVQTVSKDGLTLSAHLYLPSSPKRMVIAMHGWRSSWANDFGMISEFWHDNDCIVLYPDERAHGKSEGEYIGFGLLERYDCIAWVNWAVGFLKEHEYDIPVYLHGISMGGATVLMAAGEELPSEVKGIISDCAFTSPYSIWKHVAENNIGISYSLCKDLLNSFCKKRISLPMDHYSTLDAMKKCNIPVLFIHGANDRFVPIQMTYENYMACRSDKRLFVVPGAGHITSYSTDTEGYQKAVTEFWKEQEKITE
ncbi:MAG: alpha/beta hydrolase [Ruminococcaceae bacterium]|nr:alpha/beta hydrolase [Oscillospiraceae bacterium]